MRRMFHDGRFGCARAALALTLAAMVGAAPARRAADPAAVTALLRRGQTALNGASFADAKAAFAAAVAADPTNAAANRGLGFALLKLGDAKGALGPLQAAVGKGSADRSLTLAMAAARVATGGAVRAVKHVSDYLQAHPTLADEGLVNALGVALSRVDRSAMAGAVFKQGEQLYLRANGVLEQGRPGEKRWGTAWQPAETVDREMGRWRAAQRRVADASSKVAQIERDRRAALEQARSDAQSLGYSRRDAVIRDQNQASDLAIQESAAQATLDRANEQLAGVQVPTFPQAVAADDLDLTVVPGMSAGPAVAGAAPVAPPGVPPVATAARPAATFEPPTDGVPDPPTDPAATPGAPADPPAATARSDARYGAAFAVAPDLVVTAASVVDGARQIHLDTANGLPVEASVVRVDGTVGLALLRATGANLPTLAVGATTAGPIRCGGFPRAGLFNPVPRLLDGTADVPRPGVAWTVQLTATPRLPGGPLLGADGSVVGVELGDVDVDPAAVPAVSGGALRRFVGADARPGMAAAGDPRRAIVQVVAERP